MGDIVLITRSVVQGNSQAHVLDGISQKMERRTFGFHRLVCDLDLDPLIRITLPGRGALCLRNTSSFCLFVLDFLLFCGFRRSHCDSDKSRAPHSRGGVQRQARTSDETAGGPRQVETTGTNHLSGIFPR